MDLLIEREDDKRTILHVAATLGLDSVIRAVLDARGDIPAALLLDANDQLSATPLHLAARSGHTSTIALLLKSGATCGLRENLMGMTALHEAALRVNPAAVKLLLEHPGCDPGVTAFWRRSAMHLAVMSCEEGVGDNMARKQVVEMLLQAGAGLNDQDLDGETVLSTAVQNGVPEVVELMVAHKANVRLPNVHGMSPIASAISTGNVVAITVLFEDAADIVAEMTTELVPLAIATQCEPALSKLLELSAVTNHGLEGTVMSDPVLWYSAFAAREELFTAQLSKVPVQHLSEWAQTLLQQIVHWGLQEHSALVPALVKLVPQQHALDCTQLAVDMSNYDVAKQIVQNANFNVTQQVQEVIACLSLLASH